MALKFLNKKGWHTGSLRNIEKVWKAEQKKLEELRLQIQQEKERTESRAIKEEEFSVAKENVKSSGHGVSFRNQDQRARADASVSSNKNKKQKLSIPGALFDNKAHVANDSWRIFHSDPLLLIRQQEQKAWKSRKDKDGATNEHMRKHQRIV